MQHNLLLVDDDPFILEGTGEDLKQNGYQVVRADSGEKAVWLLQREGFDLVITDLVMEKTDGIQVLKKAKDLNPETMVIILTGYADITFAVDALRNQADDYLLKPCESEEMIHRVNQCLQKAKLSRDINYFQKFLRMCCVCKKICLDQHQVMGHSEWVSIEKFIHNRTNMEITSSYCPDCVKTTMEEFGLKKV